MSELLLVAVLFGVGGWALGERRRRRLRAAAPGGAGRREFALPHLRVPSVRLPPHAATVPTAGPAPLSGPGTAPPEEGWAPAPFEPVARVSVLALAGPLRRAAVFAIPALALIAFVGFGGNSFRAHAVLSLLAAVALYLLICHSEVTLPSPFSCVRRLGRLASAPDLRIEVHWSLVALFAIMLTAAFFRYYRLTETPSEMTSDHAEAFLDMETIQAGARPIFFRANDGPEGMQLYLGSLLMGITGYTYLTLKLVTVTASLLEIPFVYLLGRTLFGVSTGLFAALLLAVSKWDIAIARFSARASFASLWSGVCLFLVYRGIARRSRNAFLLLGIAMGLGLYGHTAFRAVPLFVAVVVGACLLFDRTLVGQRRALLVNSALSYGLTLIVALPLLRLAIDSPERFGFLGPATTTAADIANVGPGLMVFLGNFWNILLMFNVRGGHDWTQAVPTEPLLDSLTGILLLVGVGYGLGRLVRWREVMPATLLAGIAILTLPSTLALASPLEDPQPNRAAAVIPVVFVLAAVPLWQGWRVLRSRAPGLGGTALGIGVLIAVVGIAAQLNYQSYFIAYDRVHRRNTPNQKEIAAVINSFAREAGTSQSVWILLWPHWFDHRVLALELGDFSWKDNRVLDQVGGARQHAGQPGPKLYVLHREDARSVEGLRELFPHGTLREHPSAQPGREFRSFLVPA